MPTAILITQVVAVLLALACVAFAQFPAGWNYNPFLYYPYSALHPPAQETAEVAAARRAHMAAHAQALARGKRSFDLETPEVKAATLEFYRAYAAAAAANGIVMALPSRYTPVQTVPQPIQETPEVAAARAAHMAAHAAALARGKRSFDSETPEVKAATIEFYRAYAAAAAANGIIASLPSRYTPVNTVLQTVQETPEVAAARAAHMAAHDQALARGKRSFDLETPEVKAATLEFYRAYAAAAAANGIVMSLPSRYTPVQTVSQTVQETPEVAAARATHMAAHAQAMARLG